MSIAAPYLLIALAVVVMFIASRRSGRAGQRQCPVCGAWCDHSDHVCEYCGYAFESS